MSVPRESFEVVMKSTLDRLCYNLTAALVATGDAELANLVSGQLDNLVGADEFKKSMNPALVWEINNFSQHPRDPLYSLKFSVGAKTVKDDDNYIASKIASALSNFFRQDANFFIFDYTGTVAPDTSLPNSGSIFITHVSSAGILFAENAGLKMLDVEAKVIRAI